MSKLETALAIDFARRGALVIPLVLACMIVIPLWILTMLGREGALGAGTSEGVTLHATLTLVTGFIAAIAVIHSIGKMPRFYVRPISAARLVGWQLLLGTVTIASLYVISTTVLNLAGADWPVLGPALFLATALACALAAIWTFEGSVVGQFLGCLATSLPLMFWLSRCYGAKKVLDWQVMWRNPTAIEALTLVAISLGAYACGVFGVARTRRGDVWDFAALKAWWEQLCASGPAARKFSTPWAAQAWSDGREKMELMPACMLGLAAFVGVSAWATKLMPTEELLKFMMGVPLMMLLVVGPLLFGMMAGNCAKEGRPGMKHVLATRPVTDSFLAAGILRICAVGMAWAFATWLVSLGAVVGLVYLSGEREMAFNFLKFDSFNEYHPILVWLSMPVVSWTVTSCMASFFATGKPWLWVSVIFGFFGMGLVAYVVRSLVTPETYQILTNIWLVFSGGLCVVGSIVAFFAASRLRLVSTPTMVIAVAAWLVLLGGLIAIAGPKSEQSFLLAHVAGVLTLAVTPFAALPLAVRYNRHK